MASFKLFVAVSGAIVTAVAIGAGPLSKSTPLVALSGQYSGYSMTADAIYASGRRDGVPIGLLKSTDGGASWRSLALDGEAEFAVLAAGRASNTVYVLNTSANSEMPEPGIYWTRDDGAHWHRAAARGLEGVVRGLAAHPREAATVAAATSQGLFVSHDAGGRFRLLDGKQPVSAVAFDPDGRRLYYVRADAKALRSIALDGSSRGTEPLPAVGIDFVEHIAQNPADENALAIATRRRKVFVSSDGGSTWRQISGPAP